MANIKCKQCGTILGKTSKTENDDDYLCGVCDQAIQLEKALTKGEISNHDLLSDAKIKEIIKKVKSSINLGKRNALKNI